MAGTVITFFAAISLRPPLPLLLLPPAVGAALGAAAHRSRRSKVVLVLGLVATLPAVYGIQIVHLHLLASRIPLPPGATRTGGKVGSAEMMGTGPFAQVDFRTALDFDAVVGFYDSVLTTRGWTRHHCFTLDEFSFYTYRRSTHKVLITIWRATDAADHSRHVQTTHYFPAEREPSPASPESCAPVRTLPL